jgi:hypothetical protein
MRKVHASLAGAFAALALVATACGTTVSQSQLDQANGAGDLGLPTQGTTGSLPPGQAGAPGASGGPSTSALGGSQLGGPGGTANGSNTLTSVGNGPGVTPTTISIGTGYEPDTNSADAAIGAANAGPGDIKAETQAVINYINSHGGVAHRKLAPVWYAVRVQNSADTSSQQECSTWTQDNKVLVWNAGGNGNAILDECAARAHTVQLNSGAITQETTATNAKYPSDIDLEGLTIDRGMRYTIEGLHRQNYFTSGARLGIVTWDDPFYSYGIAHAAVPALAALGLHNVPVSYVASPGSYGDLAATSASVNSAVLRYRNRGIDHVIIFDGGTGIAGGGILTLEWMQQAQSQHYHPKYGLNSAMGFNALASDLPQQQLQGSTGISWEPILDETADDFAATKQPPAGQLCEQIMTQAGQTASASNARAIQFSICNNLFFLKQILDSIKGPLNQQTIIAAINRVGTHYTSLINFGINLTAARHDAPYLVRNMSFVESCSCYKFSGTTYNPGD